MSGYLVYHPARAVSRFDNITVYHDSIDGNQDPYVWNDRFLHTYCHITPMSPALGDINFWVSGDTFPNFSHLYCDLVFVVGEKAYWRQANAIEPDDPIVDTGAAYIDHYRWARDQHPLQRRRRFTLKADPQRSFQPQDMRQKLLDVVPFLTDSGLSLAELREGLRAGFTSKPFRLGSWAIPLYEWIDQQASVKLTGRTLHDIRQQNPRLASRLPQQF